MEKSKWPRTFHTPWSPGCQSDDKQLIDCDHFIGKEVVVLPKWDGECTSIYNDGYHARSVGMPNHPSQALMKAKWGEVAHLIPDNMRISGEYMFAKHSIHYHNLPDWFLVFGIVQDNVVLSYDDKLEWCELLGLTPIEAIWRGQWDEEFIKGLGEQVISQGWNGEDAEGIVIWNSKAFPFEEFAENVCKVVRRNHIPSGTETHWRNKPVTPNELRKN